MGTVILMLKTQIGLGVLAIPSALNTLGMVPGIICLIIVACITTWSGYVIGTFKLHHREVYSIDDAGGIMFGVVGRGILSTGFCLCMFSDRNILPNRRTRLGQCLIFSRLHLHQWIRYTWTLYRPKCSLDTCYMHCSFLNCCCYLRIRLL